MTSASTVRRTLLIALGLALLVAGCGGSSKSDGGPSASVASGTKGTVGQPATTRARGSDTTTSPGAGGGSQSGSGATPGSRKRSGARHGSAAKGAVTGKRRRRGTRSHGGSRAPASPSGGGAETKTAFIARGDGICQRFRAAEQGLGQQPGDNQGRGAWFDHLAGLVEQAVADFRAKPAPPTGRDTIESYLGLLSRNAVTMHRLGDAARRNDQAQQITLTKESQDVSGRANALARSYGFHVCGSS